MSKSNPKPKFIVDDSGKKSGVLLSLRDYKKLSAAWEEVADAEDFAEAKKTARGFVSSDELRIRVNRPG